jgi:hypothetical protein
MAPKQKDSTRTLKIPAPNLGKIVVTIRGTTPLLQNRWRPSQIEQIESKQQKKAAGKKEARNPQAEFQEILEQSTFSDNGKKVYGHPKEAFVHAMASAAGRVGEHKMTEIRAGIRVASEHDLIPIEGPTPELDTKMGRIKGTFTPAYRPRYWPWEMKVPLEFDLGVVNDEQVIRILQDAGRCIGLGSYRPENKGTFGTFVVVSAVEEVA